MIDWLRVPMKVLAPVLSEAAASAGGPPWRRGRKA